MLGINGEVCLNVSNVFHVIEPNCFGTRAQFWMQVAREGDVQTRGLAVWDGSPPILPR